MKNWKYFTLIVFMALLVFTFMGCGEPCSACGQKDCVCYVVKPQSANLDNLFNNDTKATVTSTTLSNLEWRGVADTIEAAIKAEFINGEGLILIAKQSVFKHAFQNGNNVQIIVEKTPIGYTKWKTSADGKTLYLAFGALDTDLQGSIKNAVTKMATPEAGSE